MIIGRGGILSFLDLTLVIFMFFSSRADTKDTKCVIELSGNNLRFFIYECVVVLIGFVGFVIADKRNLFATRFLLCF